MDRGLSDDLAARLPSRSRVGWWGFVLALGVVVAYVVSSFVGLVVLGLFGYYATRPICVRLQSVVNSRQLAAVLTALAVLVPTLGIFVFAGLRLLQSVQQRFDGGGLIGPLIVRIIGIDALPETQRDWLISLLVNPASVLEMGGSFWSNIDTALTALQGVFGGLLLLGLATTLAYVLLANDAGVSETLVELLGGRESTAYAYAVAVDADLESVFFGNLLFGAAMAVLATATYTATNLVAPADLEVPMVLVAGFLTGLASLIPIVVGKLIYVPIVALLGFQAVSAGNNASLAFVAIVLGVYVLVLDILPQSILQPYLSGRRINPVLLLFAYLLGPILFGWYGFFLMPILFVLVFEAIRIVLPELLGGESIQPEATTAEAAVTDPKVVRGEYEDPSDADESDSDTTG
ncbi:AI-2E family transporter [Halobellus captivus]|uniref:AI-2E family transporter n=1 Tax=Halobellus captivus TaxID=2592614 RepID=UPI001EF0813C|nr:AI-2E family transporter [Halobellus captivus]